MCGGGANPGSTNLPPATTMTCAQEDDRCDRMVGIYLPTLSHNCYRCLDTGS